MKAYLPFIHQVEVLKERHGDLFKHLAQNVLFMNGAFIEHHNSRMASIIHQKQLSIDVIQRAAVQGAMRADINDILYKRRVGEGELSRELLCPPKIMLSSINGLVNNITVEVTLFKTNHKMAGAAGIRVDIKRNSG